MMDFIPGSKLTIQNNRIRWWNLMNISYNSDAPIKQCQTKLFKSTIEIRNIKWIKLKCHSDQFQKTAFFIHY